MLKFSLSVVVLCGLTASLSGCEDNPDQTFKKAPAGAGDLWNDGKTPATYDRQARNTFADSFNAASKQEICSGPVKAARWSEMVNQPVKPPRLFAGLDLAGGEAWTGLDFRDAERGVPGMKVDGKDFKGNCQSNSLGGDEETLTASWGDSNEVLVQYKLSNNTIEFLQLNQGYRGTLDFASRPDEPNKPNPFGQHKYSIGVGKVIQRDGSNWELNWSNPAILKKQATELYDAMMFTFAPELPGNQDDCVTTAVCVARETGGGEAFFGARPIGMYLHIPSVYNPAPAPSTPDYLYTFFVKLMPFSTAEMFLSLDRVGPTALARKLGTREVDCNMRLGQSYGEFLDNCVNVTKEAAENQKVKAKLLGGITHTTENFVLSVEGVNLDFSSLAIGEDKVIQDGWEPQAADEATQFILDIRASGKALNDYAADKTTFTFQGTGTVYREFARRVQADIHARMKEWDPTYQPHPIGAEECLFPAGANPDTWKPAAGCTGFEAFVTPAAPDTQDPGVNRVSIGANTARALGFKSAMKPGDPVAVFCSDPGTFDHCGGQEHVGYRGSLFDGSFKRVVDYLGGGDILRLPPALRDRKYYFKHWGHAYIKYMKAALEYPTDLSKPEYDKYEPEPDHLLFNQIGSSGDREKFEYIDRRYTAEGQEPTKLEYESLIISGNQQDTRFHRRMTRAERALYWAMAKDKNGHLAGNEDNVRLSNLVGSVVIATNWSGKDATKDAYFCATHEDAECPSKPPRDSKRPEYNKVHPQCPSGCLLDDFGNPLLTNYRGAFTKTIFSVGTAYLKLVETIPLLRAAKVAVPNWPDPYSPPGEGAQVGQPRIVLVEWKPKMPGNGTRIPLNAQRDKFIPSATANFSGSSLSLDLDYDPQPDGSMQIDGLQSNEYMGDIFLCVDPASGDLLRAEQYESMAEIQDWLRLHPGADSECELVVRYSAFNNYPVMLAAKKAGIVVNVGQGSGVGRITTIEMYDPSL